MWRKCVSNIWNKWKEQFTQNIAKYDEYLSEFLPCFNEGKGSGSEITNGRASISKERTSLDKGEKIPKFCGRTDQERPGPTLFKVVTSGCEICYKIKIHQTDDKDRCSHDHQINDHINIGGTHNFVRHRSVHLIFLPRWGADKDAVPCEQICKKQKTGNLDSAACTVCRHTGTTEGKYQNRLGVPQATWLKSVAAWNRWWQIIEPTWKNAC